MLKTSTNLETFDPIELLTLLGGQGRTGALRVDHPEGTFRVWLERGRVRHLGFGAEAGTAALVRLLRDPRGRFHFDEGLTYPGARLDVGVDDLALEALAALPASAPEFDGPARVTSPERVAAMRWSLPERDLLRQIEAGRPLDELAQDPQARRLISALSRLGLLARRESRVARLTVTLTREVHGTAVVDGVIWEHWREGSVRHISHVAVRAAGQVVTLPVRGGAGLGTRLLVPPELLVQARLRVGESVLVRPAERG